jgi:exopolysaccharide biosynthesis polyprenyl glycosylphosphotransferase
MTESPNTPRNTRQLQLSERRILLMAGDTIAILLAVLLSLIIWIVVDGRGWGIRFVVAHIYWFPLLAVLWLLLATANDLYNLRVSAQIDTCLLRLVQVKMQLLGVYLVIFFFSPRDTLPRLFILYYSVLSFILIAIWRVWRSLVGRVTSARRRALVIGAGWAATAIIEALHREAPGDYEIVGQIVEPGDPLPEGTSLPWSAATVDLLEIAQRKNISEIILAEQSQLSGHMFQAVVDCYEHGLSIVPMPVLYEQVTGRVPVEHIGQRYWTTMLPIEGGSIFDPYPPIKRAGDIVLSLVGLVCLAGLLPWITLAIWLDSPGPLFYRQTRVGKGGRTFQLYKLRSMIPDAEQHAGPQWTAQNDVRITRIGNILRKTRLDEAPQLINVLRGDMSLIGPRPERPVFVERLTTTIPFYRTRLVVRPGITGWAQVRYRYGSTDEDALIKLQYDLYYIRHRSLALDLLILLRTVGQMVSLRGR